MLANPGIAVAAAVAAGGTWLALRSRTRSRVIRAAERVVPLKREHATHKIVSQGRAFAKGYSGCGDLWNYVLDVVGAPDRYVNRDSRRRGLRWKEAVNISKPWGAALADGSAVKFTRGGPWPKAGDLLLIGREPAELAHVLVLTKRLGPRRYRTAEYGGASNAGGVGIRTFTAEGKNIPPRDAKFVDNRHIVGWIDADKIPVERKYVTSRVV
jgi:hypothetical protein